MEQKLKQHTNPLTYTHRKTKTKQNKKKRLTNMHKIKQNKNQAEFKTLKL